MKIQCRAPEGGVEVNKTMEPRLPIGDRVPGLAMGMVGLVVLSVLATFGFAVGGALRLLEIHSIFDRWLPSWSGWHFLAAIVVGWLLVRMLMKATHRATGIPE